MNPTFADTLISQPVASDYKNSINTGFVNGIMWLSAPKNPLLNSSNSYNSTKVTALTSIVSQQMTSPTLSLVPSPIRRPELMIKRTTSGMAFNTQICTDTVSDL